MWRRGKEEGGGDEGGFRGKVVGVGDEDGEDGDGEEAVGD